MKGEQMSLLHEFVAVGQPTNKKSYILRMYMSI